MSWMSNCTAKMNPPSPYKSMQYCFSKRFVPYLSDKERRDNGDTGQNCKRDRYAAAPPIWPGQ